MFFWETESLSFGSSGPGRGREMMDITSEHSSLGRDESELESGHKRNLASYFSLGRKKDKTSETHMYQ